MTPKRMTVELKDGLTVKQAKEYAKAAAALLPVFGWSKADWTLKQKGRAMVVEFVETSGEGG